MAKREGKCHISAMPHRTMPNDPRFIQNRDVSIVDWGILKTPDFSITFKTSQIKLIGLKMATNEEKCSISAIVHPQKLTGKNILKFNRIL